MTETAHAAQVVPDGGLYRVTCPCGFVSKLCRSKAAAERCRNNHPFQERTVSSRLSRLSRRSPPGQKRTALYDSSAEACVDAKGRQKP